MSHHERPHGKSGTRRLFEGVGVALGMAVSGNQLLTEDAHERHHSHDRHPGHEHAATSFLEQKTIRRVKRGEIQTKNKDDESGKNKDKELFA